MAIIISESQAAEQLSECRKLLSALISQRRTLARRIKTMKASGQSQASIVTSINNLLTDWDALRDEVVTTLGAIHGTAVQVEIEPGAYEGVPSFYVKPIDQGLSAHGVIRVNPEHEQFVSPFDQVFFANDYIRISNAADTNMNGRYRIAVSPGAAQEDVISNGTFTTTADWTEASANVAITGGRAVFTAANGSGDKLNQATADMATAWTNNKVYMVTITMSNISSGSLTIGTNGNTAQGTISSNGTYNFLITADNHADGLIFTPVSFTGNLDNVSAIGWTGLLLTTPFYNDVNVDYASDSRMKITLEER